MEELKGKVIRGRKVHFAHRRFYSIAKYARDNIRNNLELAAVCLTYSFSTIESFINESLCSRELFCGGRLSARERRMYDDLKRLVTGRNAHKVSISQKYKKAKVIFSRQRFRSNSHPDKDFEILRNLRNAVIHRAPEVILSERVIGENGVTISVEYPRPKAQLNYLVSIGVLETFDEADSWLYSIETTEFCEWCCRVALDVTNFFLNSLENGVYKDKIIERMSLEIEG
ncbi:hypothetical protein CDB79_RS00585 [Vibrio parahaemolyticus]|uniref:hypothetical protein n=1 Tax=Vibrio parahaemolyticus TaxID=670 RepID=UPI000415F170|nr:hypothetical protein [Vibrio parahaemolyticus]EJG1707951.1 hypothetical protein [Vibrio parahaemolyticus]EJG1740461.1 hypothetical protein [Vibrio parahaemolyticus]EJG1780310.1 hypothetical protein [Vibrio parahaemolyticus]MDF4443829.1 hypothetical protein [Vibrio parahaemolyticus]MDF4735483.1 hypothetical protein [Vibrio parahaemolyticus]